MTTTAFGGLLRHHRQQRGLSQLALALRVETTTRHLSYVENGRSRPGRAFVLRVADALDLPLRSRNELLVAAGLSAEFPTHPLSSAVLAPYRRAITTLITALEPYPAFVLDSLYRVVDANASARRLVPKQADEWSLIDALLGPGPGREMITNFAEVAWSMSARLARASVHAPRSAEMAALEKRLASYLADVPRPVTDATGEPVICPTLRISGRLIRTIGMTMRFGPSREVTLEGLQVDVLYPRDDEGERWFREHAS
jgi:transcriptional regulator with XRE-family HTH domain